MNRLGNPFNNYLWIMETTLSRHNPTHQHHVMQGCLRLDENANIIIPSMIYDCEIDNGSTLITSLVHDTVAYKRHMGCQHRQ